MTRLPAVTASPSSLPVPSNVNYAPAVRRFNLWAGGRPVTEDTIKEFFEDHKGKFSAATLQLWKNAVKQAVLAAMPTYDMRVLAAMRETFRQIKVPKPEKALRSGDVLTQEQIRAVIREAPLRVGLFIQAMYDTAARVSELAGVRLDNCRIEGSAARMRVTGKGGLERELTIAAALFRRLRKETAGKTYLFEKGYVESGLGAGRDTDGPWNRKVLWRHIDRAAVKALGRRVNDHMLRHSRATHLLESGVPLAAVSRFLGHRQVKTTLAFYAHNEMTPAQILKGRL